MQQLLRKRLWDFIHPARPGRLWSPKIGRNLGTEIGVFLCLEVFHNSIPRAYVMPATWQIHQESVVLGWSKFAQYWTIGVQIKLWLPRCGPKIVNLKIPSKKLEVKTRNQRQLQLSTEVHRGVSCTTTCSVLEMPQIQVPKTGVQWGSRNGDIHVLRHMSYRLMQHTEDTEWLSLSNPGRLICSKGICRLKPRTKWCSRNWLLLLLHHP